MDDYATSLDHVLGELARLDVLIRVQVWRARNGQVHDASGLPAYYIAESEVDALLDKAIGAPTWATVALPRDMADAVHIRLRQISTEIAERAAASLRRGVRLRLVELAELFDLTAFDVDVILLCLAPEIDQRYERLYAYLHDDVTRRQPTVDLVLNLLAPDLNTKVAMRSRVAATAPLVRHQLVRLGPDLDRHQQSLLGTTLRIDPRVARFLLDDNDVAEDLPRYASTHTSVASLDDMVFPEPFRRRLRTLVQVADRADGPTHRVLYLQGGYGVGRRTAAAACCHGLGGPLLVVDGLHLATPELPEFAALVSRIDREARLQGAFLYWEEFDALLADDRAAHLATVISTLAARPGLTFVAGQAAWEPREMPREVTFVRLEFSPPTSEERLRLWRAALASDRATDRATTVAEPSDPALDLEGVAASFRLTGGQIIDAVASARSLARARDAAAPRITQHDLTAACRLQSNRRLADLAQKIVPRYRWDDLVLPSDQMTQLREIDNHVRYRGLVHDAWGFARKLSMGKGLSVLFVGPPGTGKTMAADVLAAGLGLDLYKIDLSTVVSKYIGETEKNLARIFGEAATSNAILFFDEADALFGKRTQVRDAHDRYANVEISYLLQKMDEYEGVVVLATNLRKNTDEAFVRRLQFVVEFPAPDAAGRHRIWTQIWPAATPRDPGLDLEFLARHIEVTGGHIRNIALAGAFLAAADGGVVTMRHLVRATRREYQKLGKVLSANEFGDYGGAECQNS